MKDRKNAHLINRWIQQGFIQTTAGATTDHSFIEYAVKKISEHIGLGEIWLDRTKADILITNLSNFGIEMVKFGQGYASMSSAVDIMEKLTLDKKVNYGKNPVLRWMNGNTVIQQDPAGNRKFNKDKAQDKIDGIVASAMALTGIYLGEETEESIYNERGAIFF